MTPSELMALASSIKDRCSCGCEDSVVMDAVPALRSYAELCAALEYLDGDAASVLKSLTDNLQTENVTELGLVSFAKRLGWPGLEEA